MTPFDELTRTGAGLVVRSARRAARRAALSAALWALAMVFLSLMLGFGAVGLFLLLSVTQGTIVAAFFVAAISGVLAAIIILVAMHPASGHERDQHEAGSEPHPESHKAQAGLSPETTAMAMTAGFLTGLLSGEK